MRSSQRAFTLVEVLAALAIVGIVTSLLSPVFAMQAKQNTTSELKSQAIDAITRRLDELRLSDPGSLPSSGSATSTYSIGGRSFVVTTNYCLTSSYCTVVTRHLKLTARYKGTAYYATETVFTQLR